VGTKAKRLVQSSEDHFGSSYTHTVYSLLAGNLTKSDQKNIWIFTEHKAVLDVPSYCLTMKLWHRTFSFHVYFTTAQWWMPAFIEMNFF